MLVGREIVDDEEDERSAATWASLTRLPEPIAYNPAFPIETFDFIVTDECHRNPAPDPLGICQHALVEGPPLDRFFQPHSTNPLAPKYVSSGYED